MVRCFNYLCISPNEMTKCISADLHIIVKISCDFMRYQFRMRVSVSKEFGHNFVIKKCPNQRKHFDPLEIIQTYGLDYLYQEVSFV